MIIYYHFFKVSHTQQSKSRKSSKNKLMEQHQQQSTPPLLSQPVKHYAASDLLATLEHIHEQKTYIRQNNNNNSNTTTTTTTTTMNITEMVTNLSQLNETRQNILELCGSDAHQFLSNVVARQSSHQPSLQQRSRLRSTTDDVTSSGLEHSKLSSDSIPDLVNTDFEAVSNSDFRASQPKLPLLATTTTTGLETSSSFEEKFTPLLDDVRTIKSVDKTKKVENNEKIETSSMIYSIKNQNPILNFS
jgi:hypothetical protein